MSDDDPKSSRNPTGEPHLSPVPLTLEGWSILHQMFRIRWAEWNALAPAHASESRRRGGIGPEVHGTHPQPAAAASCRCWATRAT